MLLHKTTLLYPVDSLYAFSVRLGWQAGGLSKKVSGVGCQVSGNSPWSDARCRMSDVSKQPLLRKCVWCQRIGASEIWGYCSIWV